MGLDILVLIALFSMITYILVMRLRAQYDRFTAAAIAGVMSGCVWALCANLQRIPFNQFVNTWIAKLSFVAAAVAILMLLYAFVAAKDIRPWCRRIAIGTFVAAVLLALSDLVVTGYRFVGNEALIQRGEWYSWWLALLGVMVLMMILQAIAAIRGSKGPQKIRSLYLLGATMAATFFGSITNGVLPLIDPATPSVRYAFLSIVVWAFIVMYGLVRTSLTSIEEVVQRLVGRLVAFGLAMIAFGIFVIVAQTATSPLMTLTAALMSIVVYAIVEAFITNWLEARHINKAEQTENAINALAYKKSDLEVFESASLRLLARTYDLTIASRKQLHPTPTELHRHPSNVEIISIYNVGNSPQKTFEFRGHEVIVNLYSGNRKLMRSYFVDKKNTRSYLPSYLLDELHKIFQIFAIQYENKWQFEEIQSFNELLQERIADATAELKKQNKQLKDIDQAKNDFISIASHQLRTPLTSVKGYLSMILSGDGGELSPVQRQMLNQAFASSQRMVYLIGDFLNLSRIQTGRLQFDMREADLSTTIREEAASLQAAASGHGVKVVLGLPDEPCMVKFDENKLRQVVMNFVDNAIFYSKTKGAKVEVKLKKTSRWVEFTVTDNGIGVPRNEQSRLFQKFYRASNARNRRPDGTGIGLFMAKKIVAGHGGDVVFRSTEGRGSTFGFRLPVK